MRSQIKISELISGDLRPYRYEFYRRLGNLPEVELTLYVGRPPYGQGADLDMPSFSEFRVVEVINRKWPLMPLKVLWQTGAVGVLRTDTDVVVCPELVHNLSIWWIRMRHRRAHKALVLRGFFYRSASGTAIGKFHTLLRRVLRHSAGGLVTYSERGRRDLIAEGTKPQDVFVSYNTLDTQHLIALAGEVGEHEERSIRESIGLQKNVPVITFLGRLLPVKRADVAIDAVRLLASSHSDVAMLVIGDGPEIDSLRRRASGLPIHFLGATYDERRLACYLQITQLLVLPGRVGLTCVHGFANGVPCLTTSADSVAQSPEYEYVDDGRNGLVIARADPALYAESISALLADPSRLSGLRAGALETARELTMDRMVAGYMEGVRAALGLQLS